MRISDWSSDVCSSDLAGPAVREQHIRLALRVAPDIGVDVQAVEVEVGFEGRAGGGGQCARARVRQRRAEQVAGAAQRCLRAQQTAQPEAEAQPWIAANGGAACG